MVGVIDEKEEGTRLVYVSGVPTFVTQREYEEFKDQSYGKKD